MNAVNGLVQEISAANGAAINGYKFLVAAKDRGFDDVRMGKFLAPSPNRVATSVKKVYGMT